MTAKKKFKIRIDLEFTDVKEAVSLLHQINTFSIKEYELKKQLNTSYIHLQRVMNTAFVEPKIKVINGQNCLIYPSQLNDEEETIRKFIKE